MDVEIALLEREIEELRRQAVPEQRAYDLRCVAHLLRAAHGASEAFAALRTLPMHANRFLHAAHEVGGHPELAFVEDPRDVVDQTLLGAEAASQAELFDVAVVAPLETPATLLELLELLGACRTSRLPPSASGAARSAPRASGPRRRSPSPPCAPARAFRAASRPCARGAPAPSSGARSGRSRIRSGPRRSAARPRARPASAVVGCAAPSGRPGGSSACARPLDRSRRWSRSGSVGCSGRRHAEEGGMLRRGPPSAGAGASKPVRALAFAAVRAPPHRRAGAGSARPRRGAGRLRRESGSPRCARFRGTCHCCWPGPARASSRRGSGSRGARG